MLKCVKIDETNFPDDKERAEELRISYMLSSAPNDVNKQPTNPPPTPGLPAEIRQIEWGSDEIRKATPPPTVVSNRSLTKLQTCSRYFFSRNFS